jgi:hypothetical protein
MSIALGAAGSAQAQELSSSCETLQTPYTFTNLVGVAGDFFVGEIVSIATDSTVTVSASASGGSTYYTSTGTSFQVVIPADGFNTVLFSPTATGTMSCSLPPPVNGAANLASAAAEIAATNQHNQMADATSHIARDRLMGRGGNAVTARSVFLSTQNFGESRLDRPDYNLWISGGYTSFSGGMDGNSADVLMGVDRLFGENFLAGLMLAYGRTDLERDGVESEVRSPAVGTYFASRFGGDLLLDGYLAYARPEVEAGGGSVTGRRLSGSVQLSGSREMAAGTLRPFLRIGGYDQHLPAYANDGGPVEAEDVQRFDAYLGVRFESARPLGNSGLMPYVSLAAGYGMTDSSTSVRDEYFYPRLGLGVSGELARGHLSLDLDGGKLRSYIYDIGLSLAWETKF